LGKNNFDIKSIPLNRKKRKVIIPIFVPHKGCPNDCVFCNQRKITGCINPATVGDVEKAVDERINTISPEFDEIEIAFFGGSFTMIPIHDQEELLEAANEYRKKGLIKDIRISTRPDGIDEVVINRLRKYGVTIVELGIQSMRDEVLKQSKRGYLSEVVPTAIERLKKNGFIVGVQVMTGLPGASLESEVETAKLLCAYKPDIARIYPTLVIKDTELEKMYSEGSYVPQAIEAAVEAASRMLDIFIENNVQVIRIGLQPTDEIAEGCDVVAGPFHPAMGELVEGRRYRRILEEAIKNRLMTLSEKEQIPWINVQEAVKQLKIRELEIHCEPGMVSKLIGQKKVNKIYFQDLLGLKNIKVIEDGSSEKLYLEFFKEVEKS